MRISLGSRLTGGQQASSTTCMSEKLGTPSEDWESLAPRKKSDSSLSAGAGEFVDEEDRESSRAELPAPDGIAAMVFVRAGAGRGRLLVGLKCEAVRTRDWRQGAKSLECSGRWRSLDWLVGLLRGSTLGLVDRGGGRDRSGRFSFSCFIKDKTGRNRNETTKKTK